MSAQRKTGRVVDDAAALLHRRLDAAHPGVTATVIALVAQSLSSLHTPLRAIRTYALPDAWYCVGVGLLDQGGAAEPAIRVVRFPDEAEPPPWVARALQLVAHCASTDPDDVQPDRIVRMTGPVGGADAPATAAFLLSEDPALPRDSRSGAPAPVVLLVGLHADEADVAAEWDVARVAELLAWDAPLLATVPARPSLLTDTVVRATIENEIAREGSRIGSGRAAVLHWARDDPARCVLTVSVDAVPKLRRMAYGRIPHERPFLLVAGDRRVVFERGVRGVTEEDDGLHVQVSERAAHALLDRLPDGPGTFEWTGVTGLTIEVVTTPAAADIPLDAIEPVSIVGAGGEVATGLGVQAAEPVARSARLTSRRSISPRVLGGILCSMIAVALPVVFNYIERERAPKPPSMLETTLAETQDLLERLQEEQRERERAMVPSAPDVGAPAPFRHGAPVACVAVADAAGIVVSGGEDGRIRLWDAQSGESGLTLEAHRGFIDFVAITPDGRRLVSASSWSGDVKVWDVAEGEAETTLRIAEPSDALVPESEPDRPRVRAVAWTADARPLVIVSTGPAAHVLDLSREDFEEPVFEIFGVLPALSPAGDFIAVPDLGGGFGGGVPLHATAGKRPDRAAWKVDVRAGRSSAQRFSSRSITELGVLPGGSLIVGPSLMGDEHDIRRYAAGPDDPAQLWVHSVDSFVDVWAGTGEVFATSAKHFVEIRGVDDGAVRARFNLPDATVRSVVVFDRLGRVFIGTEEGDVLVRVWGYAK